MPSIDVLKQELQSKIDANQGQRKKDNLIARIAVSFPLIVFTVFTDFLSKKFLYHYIFDGQENSLGSIIFIQIMSVGLIVLLVLFWFRIFFPRTYFYLCDDY